MGRARFELAAPATSRTVFLAAGGPEDSKNNNINNNHIGGRREFKSCPVTNSIEGLGGGGQEPESYPSSFMILEWSQFYQFLIHQQRPAHNAALDKVRYAKRYV